MDLKWKLRKCTLPFKTANGAYCLMDVHRGTLVKYIAVRVNIVFNAMTSITIGDPAGPTKYGTVTHGSLQLENLAGEYLTTDYDGGPNANGKLYTADDTINATYTKSDGPTTGEMTVYIVYAEIE